MVANNFDFMVILPLNMCCKVDIDLDLTGMSEKNVSLPVCEISPLL